MTLSKVSTGDRLKIPADAYNAFVDAAFDFQLRQVNSRDHDRFGQPPTNVILVKNTSDVDVPRYGVLGLDSPVISPEDNAGEFFARLAMIGVKPTADHADRFVVMAEPVAKDTFGWGYVFGYVTVMLDVRHEDDRYACIEADRTESLISAGSGSVAILWKLAGTGMRPAIVRLMSAAKSNLSIARIPSRVGTTSPFVYSGEEVEYDGSGVFGEENFVAVSGGVVMTNSLVNAEEFGEGGQWVNPLQIGSVVFFSPLPGAGGWHICSQSHYRGTY